jgi:hypothetical protein
MAHTRATPQIPCSSNMRIAEIDVETRAADERSGFSPPLTQRNAAKYFGRTLPGYSFLGGGDGFVPVLISAVLAASALLLALE